MSDKNSAPKSGSTLTPVIIQFENAFNAGIIMEMHTVEREKLSYIRGKKKQPPKQDPGYEKWYAENQKVKKWLLLSMSLEIMTRYLCLATTHEIWSALSKAFYDGSDELQVFTSNQKAFIAKQNGRPLSEYYGELMEICQELDHRDKVVMKDPKDVTAYKKSIGRLRVHIFLVGLDGEFEQIRREILCKEPVPKLENSYALIRREDNTSSDFESSKQKLAGSKKENHPKANSNIDKSEFKCTHYNQQGHTKCHCFELNGYPDWWDHNRDQRRKNPAASVVEAKTIDEASKESTALMAIRGNGGEFSVPITNSTWIIDSGATDHMTFDSRQISSMKPSSKKLISTANGDTTSEVRKRFDYEEFYQIERRNRILAMASLNKSIVPFMLIHSDVWGPSKISSLRGSRWFVTFIDYCTRMTWLWLMKSKGEVNLIIQKFHKMIETQYNAKVQVLSSDNCGKYQSLDLKRNLEAYGIIHQTTCPNTRNKTVLPSDKIDTY
ncbi:hypothetical protein V8G54_010255 [Vigna mungo]|uniref:Integrase catalytic domain-containing protein n=1 Tax=Vigna mungo TaxID=3915 RepID=A0AAQ3NZP2_VIGMU